MRRRDQVASAVLFFILFACLPVYVIVSLLYLTRNT